MYSKAFKLDFSLYHSPEEVSGMLDFIEKDPDLIIESFLQGKALGVPEDQLLIRILNTI